MKRVSRIEVFGVIRELSGVDMDQHLPDHVGLEVLDDQPTLVGLGHVLGSQHRPEDIRPRT